MYIDAHCHLADPRLKSELPRWMSEAKARGIGVFVQGGVDPGDWERQRSLKTQYPGQIITAYGLHPWWVATHSEAEFELAFTALGLQIGEADALGEFGLDHAPKWEQSTYPAQLRALRAQLGLLKRAAKPVVLHVVRAHEPVLESIQESGLRELTGLVHSFSASKEIAKKYLDLGLTLSISGVITRKGFETLRRAVSYIPIDRLVLETDSPDQKPDGWDREWNEPLALFQVAEAVAEIRGTKAEDILQQSAANLKKVFRI